MCKLANFKALALAWVLAMTMSCSSSPDTNSLFISTTQEETVMEDNEGAKLLEMMALTKSVLDSLEPEIAGSQLLSQIVKLRSQRRYEVLGLSTRFEELFHLIDQNDSLRQKVIDGAEIQLPDLPADVSLAEYINCLDVDYQRQYIELATEETNLAIKYENRLLDVLDSVSAQLNGLSDKKSTPGTKAFLEFEKQYIELEARYSKNDYQLREIDLQLQFKDLEYLKLMYENPNSHLRETEVKFEEGRALMENNDEKLVENALEQDMAMLEHLSDVRGKILKNSLALTYNRVVEMEMQFLNLHLSYLKK